MKTETEERTSYPFQMQIPIYLYADATASLNNLYLENQTIALKYNDLPNSTKIVSLRICSSGNIFNIIYSALHLQALRKY